MTATQISIVAWLGSVSLISGIVALVAFLHVPESARQRDREIEVIQTDWVANQAQLKNLQDITTLACKSRNPEAIRFLLDLQRPLIEKQRVNNKRFSELIRTP